MTLQAPASVYLESRALACTAFLLSTMYCLIKIKYTFSCFIRSSVDILILCELLNTFHSYILALVKYYSVFMMKISHQIIAIFYCLLMICLVKYWFIIKRDENMKYEELAEYYEKTVSEYQPLCENLNKLNPLLVNPTKNTAQRIAGMEFDFNSAFLDIR